MGDLPLTDARNRLEDLSGIVLQPGENPYGALLKACDDDPAQIQALYDAHRTRRNAQQRAKFLSPAFDELVVDQHLLRLEDPSVEPGFRDDRNCFVLWSRPPDHVVRLAAKLQEMLKEAAPNLWLMPIHRMHMTTLEVAFSKTPEEIASLVAQMRPALPSTTNHLFAHRARLVKPTISYDLSAFAVSFLPAAGEPHLSPAPVGPITQGDIVAQQQGDAYTYHHVRRDIFAKVRGAGVEIASRYQVPSAHITLGRYLGQGDHDTPEKRRGWIEAVEGVNAWLEREVWDNPESEFVGEWVVGQERGLDARNGALWYGGGRTVMMGEGF